MTELEEAMLQHMKTIVLEEQRPFFFGDFARFEVDGKEYRAKHGTYRNTISKFRKLEIVELDYNSAGTSYHTLKGHKFGKMMTQNRTGGLFSSSQVGRQTALYKWLKNLPTERQSLHNIRLRFESIGIWNLFSSIYPNLVNPKNQDIILNPWTFNDGIEITVTLHRTNTVTIAVACSYKPIATDVNGLLQTVESLVRTEVELKNLIRENIQKANLSSTSAAIIPSYRKWIGVMWHFNVDGIDTYDKEEFRVSFGDGIADIYTIYTKRMKDGRVVPRIERQEYSNDPFVDIFLKKLYPGGCLNDTV